MVFIGSEDKVSQDLVERVTPLAEKPGVEMVVLDGADHCFRDLYAEDLVDQVIGAFSLDGPTKCSGLDIVQYDAKKLVSELGEGFELIEERSEIHVTPASRQQHFNYFRFVRLPEG